MNAYNVREFGAIGDGTAIDTSAIQQAIDIAAADGGGVVMLHNGCFLSGGLMLKSHVELHLSPTATLQASNDMSLYQCDTLMPYASLNRALLYAANCDAVAITGQGIITGNAAPMRAALEARLKDAWWGAAEAADRATLIRLRNCTNVRIQDVQLKDALSFHCHPIACRNLRIEGIRINGLLMPNNDGIDIDGCEDVFISNCHITCSDDGIALKAMEAGRPTRNVVVTNCVIRSHCAGVRIGPDAIEDIERVAVSNCIIHDTGLTGIKIQQSFGRAMRNMVFSNIVMDRVNGPISIRLAGWKAGSNTWAKFDDSHWEAGQISDIRFDNIRANAVKDPGGKPGISITGAGRARPANIFFSNMDICFPGGGTAEDAARVVPELERDYPEIHMFGILPAYGMYVRHVDGLSLRNLRFTTASDDLRPALVCDDVNGLEANGLVAQGHPQAASVIRLRNTQEVWLTASRATGKAPSFVLEERA